MSRTEPPPADGPVSPEARGYFSEEVTAPLAVLDALRRQVEAESPAKDHPLLQGLRAIAPVLLVVFGVVGLLDLFFGIIGPEHWLVLALGSVVIIGPMLLLWRRGAREARAERDAATADARRALAAGKVNRHELRRDARHWFVGHEHGVMLVCPADGRRTLYLDLSSVSDDERHDVWYASGRIHTERWTWFSAGATGPAVGFEATGAPLPPNLLEEAAGRHDPEDGVALFEFLGSPADGDRVPRPFAKVDAFLRARIRPRP
jgi:hypothetical protein